MSVLVLAGHTLLEKSCEPPVCVDCRHHEFNGRSWCKRLDNLEVFNVITGKYVKYCGLASCRDQRHGDSENHCGVEGKFFEPKP